MSGRHLLPQHATCSVGLSGVVFALIVAETHVNAIQHRSFYGLFTVPAVYFPWLLLVLWQFLFPHISFFGHLGGILAGVFYSRGWLASVTPSPASFQVSCPPPSPGACFWLSCSAEPCDLSSRLLRRWQPFGTCRAEYLTFQNVRHFEPHRFLGGHTPCLCAGTAILCFLTTLFYVQMPGSHPGYFEVEILLGICDAIIKELSYSSGPLSDVCLSERASPSPLALAAAAPRTGRSFSLLKSPLPRRHRRTGPPVPQEVLTPPLTLQVAEQWLPFRVCLPLDTCISSSGSGASASQELLPVSYSPPRPTPGRIEGAFTGTGTRAEGATRPSSSASFSSWPGLTSLLPGAAQSTGAESAPFLGGSLPLGACLRLSLNVHDPCAVGLVACAESSSELQYLIVISNHGRWSVCNAHVQSFLLPKAADVSNKRGEKWDVLADLRSMGSDHPPSAEKSKSLPFCRSLDVCTTYGKQVISEQVPA